MLLVKEKWSVLTMHQAGAWSQWLWAKNYLFQSFKIFEYFLISKLGEDVDAHAKRISFRIMLQEMVGFVIKFALGREDLLGF